MTVRPRLPITAFSIANALGSNVAEVAESLRLGRSGLTPVEPSFELEFPTFVGAYTGPRRFLEGALVPWDTAIARLVAKLLSDLGAAVGHAVERWGAGRVGILMGTSTAGATTTEQAYRQFVRRQQLPSSFDYSRQHTFCLLYTSPSPRD